MSDGDFTIARSIRLVVDRCWDCGTFWAYEDRLARTAVTCPKCASGRVDAAVARETKAERAVASLRGALTSRRSAA